MMRAPTARRDGPYAEPCEPLMVPLLTGRQRVEYVGAAILWLAALAYFWIWWLQPSHIAGIFGFLTVSLTLAWITLLPAYFLMVFIRARKPSGALRLPHGSRVAMVVTKAPSEPFAVVADTLVAMLDQDIPHDTWLADEDPSPETMEWCASTACSFRRAKAGPTIIARLGRAARAARKVTSPIFTIITAISATTSSPSSMLTMSRRRAISANMLRPFADPAVGYVSAPSICDRNAAESWSARGRLYAEASMHGSLQAGYNGGLAPLCIGSHYAVRTAALRQSAGSDRNWPKTIPPRS